MRREATSPEGQLPQTFFGQRRSLVPLLLLGPLFFLIILFLSTTLLTGISLHIQWPLTSQMLPHIYVI
jgi:hypothetical protein